jgi:hypothetical protein
MYFNSPQLYCSAGVLYRVFGRNLDSGLPAGYSDEHWGQVVDHLQLRPQQVGWLDDIPFHWV